MPNSQNCYLYACKVMFRNEILGVSLTTPGKLGPGLERSNWTLLNDKSLNVVPVLLVFFNFLPCLNCFSTSQSIHFFFKLLETCLIPWIKLPPVSHLSFSCSFYIWPSHSLQRKAIKASTFNR